MSGQGVDASEPPSVTLARSYRLGFRQLPDLTVGLEEELILVDPLALEPVASARWLLDRLEDPRFVAELRTVQLELACAAPDRRRAARRAWRRPGATVEVAQGRVRALAAGGHPTSLLPVAVTDLPRYREIEREFGWATRRGIPSGLHVHVALGDPDDALTVYNAARAYLPELAALAANSPSTKGPTGRSRLEPVEAHRGSSLLRCAADLPLVRLARRLRLLGRERRPLRRPQLPVVGPASAAGVRHAEFQVGICGPISIAHAAPGALYQSLVAWLRARFRAGESLPRHRTHAINENRWRAIRDGLDARLVDPESGVVEEARERLARLVLALEPTAELLGCAEELAEVWPLIERNGAVRQREIAEERGVSTASSRGWSRRPSSRVRPPPWPSLRASPAQSCMTAPERPRAGCAGARLRRGYWLRRCEGFDVLVGSRRIGSVEAVRFGRRHDAPDALIVTLRGWRRISVVVAVADVSAISAEAGRIELRSDPRGSPEAAPSSPPAWTARRPGLATPAHRRRRPSACTHPTQRLRAFLTGGARRRGRRPPPPRAAAL